MATVRVYVPGDGFLTVGDPELWEGRLHPNYRLVAEIQRQVHARHGHPLCPACQAYPTFDLRTGRGYCARCGRTLVAPQPPSRHQPPVEPNDGRQRRWLRRWGVRRAGHRPLLVARRDAQPGQRVPLHSSERS